MQALQSGGLINLVCPIVGVVVSNGMYLAPLMELLEVRKHRALHELNPIQFPMQLFNCLGWIMFGFTKGNIYLFFSSGPGSLLALWAIFTVLPYTEERTRLRMERMSLALMLLVIVTAMLVVFYVTNATARLMFVGVVTDTMFVVYMGIPLSGLMHVLQTRNAATISWKLVVCKLISAGLWWTYGMALNEPFMYAPNSLAIFLCLMQLAVVIAFRRGPPGGEGDPAALGGSTHAYQVHDDAQLAAAPHHHDDEEDPHDGQRNGLHPGGIKLAGLNGHGPVYGSAPRSHAKVAFADGAEGPRELDFGYRDADHYREREFAGSRSLPAVGRHGSVGAAGFEVEASARSGPGGAPHSPTHHDDGSAIHPFSRLFGTHGAGALGNKVRVSPGSHHAYH